MQLLIDFFPVILFFVAYKLAGMYVATAALIASMAIQLAVQWLRRRKVSRMLLVSTAVVAVFGGITLALRNPIFIEWKPTVVYWLFAGAFLGSQYFGKEPLIQRMMGHAVTLGDDMWRQLNLTWVATFLVLGAANLFVLYNFTEDTWVKFKVFGTLGVTLLMVVGQAIWIAIKTSGQEITPPSPGQEIAVSPQREEGQP